MPLYFPIFTFFDVRTISSKTNNDKITVKILVSSSVYIKIESNELTTRVNWFPIPIKHETLSLQEMRMIPYSQKCNIGIMVSNGDKDIKRLKDIRLNHKIIEEQMFPPASQSTSKRNKNVDVYVFAHTLVS